MKKNFSQLLGFWEELLLNCFFNFFKNIYEVKYIFDGLEAISLSKSEEELLYQALLDSRNEEELLYLASQKAEMKKDCSTRSLGEQK